jgi:hypothetical protein
MTTPATSIQDLGGLRDLVHRRLCDQEFLEPSVFPLTERILVRRGKPCGIFFSLHGPRSVRLTAIWETSGNRILFYNSAGERFQETRLVESPALVTAQ